MYFTLNYFHNSHTKAAASLFSWNKRGAETSCDNRTVPDRGSLYQLQLSKPDMKPLDHMACSPLRRYQCDLCCPLPRKTYFPFPIKRLPINTRCFPSLDALYETQKYFTELRI